MKLEKISFLVFAISSLSLAPTVYAVKNVTESQGVSSQTSVQVVSTQEQRKVAISPSPSGIQVKNENQVETKNQGEDTLLMENTEEQEKLGEGMGTDDQDRSQTATENMSNVAQQVQQLLQTRTTGGLGEQVKQIAQEQVQAQDQIQTELDKVNSRSVLLKSLIGPDYKAIKSMQQVMEQNQLRIQQLEQLQNQLTNKSDLLVVQETIKALTDQNVALQDRISAEEQTSSLLGWLFKLFAR